MRRALTRIVMRGANRARRRYWRWRGRPRFGATALAYTPAGTLILIRQTYVDGWCLPGGSRRRDEDPVATALRELHEEIGLSGYDEARLLTTIHRPLAGVPVTIDIVRVTSVRHAFSPNAEVDAATAFAPDRLPADLNSWTITVLTAAGVMPPG